MSGSRYHAVAADSIFDGDIVLRGSAVIVDGAHVAAVTSRGELPA